MDDVSNIPFDFPDKRNYAGGDAQPLGHALDSGGAVVVMLIKGQQVAKIERAQSQAMVLHVAVQARHQLGLVVQLHGLDVAAKLGDARIQQLIQLNLRLFCQHLQQVCVCEKKKTRERIEHKA
jgi:hypothetical protein